MRRPLIIPNTITTPRSVPRLGECKFEIIIDVLGRLPPVCAACAIRRLFDLGLFVGASLLIDRGDRRTRRVPCRKRQEPRSKRLQFADDRFPAHLVLDGYVADFAQKLFIDTPDRIAERPDQFRFALRLFRQANQHFVDVLMYSCHVYLRS